MLIVYVCEGCGDEYPSQEAAERCELLHEAEDRQERRRARHHHSSPTHRLMEAD